MSAPAWSDSAVTELRSPDGAVAFIADHGAHVLGWQPAGSGQPALYLSADSGFGAGAAIRGGVPVIFPQFGERGTGQRHGFARVSTWRRSFAGIEQGRAVARYELGHGDLAPGVWPHRFLLEYEVVLHASTLKMALRVTNTDSQAWSFNAALHTYFQVSDVARVGVHGLQGLTYLDKTDGEARCVQADEVLRIVGEVDSMYANVGAPLVIADGARRILVRQSGFIDAVVWNPGAIKAATINDLTPGTAHEFICVEAAAIMTPVTLAPGASWQGSQFLEINCLAG